MVVVEPIPAAGANKAAVLMAHQLARDTRRQALLVDMDPLGRLSDELLTEAQWEDPEIGCLGEVWDDYVEGRSYTPTSWRTFVHGDTVGLGPGVRFLSGYWPDPTPLATLAAAAAKRGWGVSPPGFLVTALQHRAVDREFVILCCPAGFHEWTRVALAVASGVLVVLPGSPRGEISLSDFRGDLALVRGQDVAASLATSVVCAGGTEDSAADRPGWTPIPLLKSVVGAELDGDQARALREALTPLREVLRG